ncbi:MAG: adenosylcobalamin-dependent ribonucleoside-diphosphate reductase, partial [Alphaproteobacteria bacterium]
TLQQGGGVGFDFSSLRPKGAPVLGVGADASGPLSFMDVWDQMCATIMSAGARRGAMMATLACDHPDIEAFIDAKHQSGRLTNFNLSVLVTDAFIEAVRADADWPLNFAGTHYRTVRAGALWQKIMRATFDYAEPGVIFIDRINAANNLRYCETISATNPCGEQPLPPYGACLLGSINLAKLIVRPFDADAHLSEAELAKLAAVAVRMLDNAIDISKFPLVAQRKEALAKRRIGLGLTGLGDALIMCGQVYGSDAGAATAARWMATIEQAAYRASTDLAREKGEFALCDRAALLESPGITRLDKQTRRGIEAHGLRNALLTSIAPTGTISLLAGNVSSGIEPVFNFTYQRTVRRDDGGTSQVEMSDYAYRLYREKFGQDTPLTKAFVTAQTLAPRDHLVMQAAVQSHIDSSISKTVNLPADISLEAFGDVYMQAFEMGLKGCTTYRPNAIVGAVLTSGETKPATTKTTKIEEPSSIVYLSTPLERDAALPGFTYKLVWPDSDHAIYITINDLVEDGRRRPFEIFINSKNMENYAWTVALTRMISAVFRRGGDVSFVVEELRAVFDPRGGQWMEGRYVPSLLAAIGGVIEQHMRDTGFMATREPAQEASLETKSARFCPKCDQPALVFAQGCYNCLSCGFAKCG